MRMQLLAFVRSMPALLQMQSTVGAMTASDDARRQDRGLSQANDTPAPETIAPSETIARRKLTKPEAEARVLALRRPVSQDALARRWGVTEAAISQWVGDWEARGIVTRARHGRCKLVQSAPRRLQVVRAA